MRAVLCLIRLHGGVAEQRRQLVVFRFDGKELVEHHVILLASRVYPPDTGGKNATSSPSATGVENLAYAAFTAADNEAR